MGIVKLPRLSHVHGGEILGEVTSGDGIGSVAAGAYPATLKRLIGSWLDAHSSIPVIASGMVGSRHGWREAAYVKCPAGPPDVAKRLTEVEADGRRVMLAPGLSYLDESGQPDVIRGEETEIFGIADAGARLIVLPGSHSKWAKVEGERVAAFRTFVTGELFAALRDHTVAGAFARAAPAKSPGQAFALGVLRGAAAASCQGGSGLLGVLFGARSLPLMGSLPEDDAGEYLSGLLIGAEIEEGRRLYPGEEPYVAGAEALVERYRAAFDALGVSLAGATAGRSARALSHRSRRGAPVTLQLAPTPLVAILRGVTPDEADSIAAVIVEAGFGAIEVPLNSPDPRASIELIARLFGDKVLVAAGTVLEPREVDEVAAAGAKLVVAPNSDPAVVERAVKLGLAAVPGVATLTEAFAALKAGASGLKLFPGEALGPDIVRAWRSVLPKEAQLYPRRRRHARAHRPLSARRRDRLRHWLGALQARRERRGGRARRADVREGVEGERVASHSRLVCRARIVSEVSLKRGRSLRIASSKAIICAVSNSEPIGRTESLPP